VAITRLGPNQDITAAKIAGTINFKNLIINGDMSIAQRGTSVTGVTTTDGYYTCDRWRSQTDIGTWTISQSTDVPTGQGFANSFKMDCTSAGTSNADEVSIRQYIEGQFLQQLAYGTSSAKSITISFWIKSNKTGDYTFSIKNVNSSQERLLGFNYTIDSANTWEKKTFTFSGDTSTSIENTNSAEFELYWWFSAASALRTGTVSNTWQNYSAGNHAISTLAGLGGSTDDEVYLTGVQLEADTSASDFEFIPYDVNLQRCQRYYQIFGSTAPTSCNMTNGMAYSANSSEVFCPTILPVVMRTGPSVTQNGTIAYRTPGGTTNVTLNSTAVSEKEVFMNFSGSFTSGDPGYIRNPDGSSSNYLEVDAEL